MPPVELTLDESLALIAMGEHVAEAEQVPMIRPAARAIAKVRSQLPRRMRAELERLVPHVHLKLTQAGPHHGIADVYELVCRAIAEGRALSCRYEKVVAEGGPVEAHGEVFMFRPYVLFFSQRAWYAVGHHGGRDALRCLKLNRFTDVQLTEVRYRIPADFTIEQHLGQAWRMIRGAERFAVVIRFDRCFAETIADTAWHATQVIEEHEDGSITFRCEVDGLEEIVWWVLSMGPHCEVIEPAALRERVAGLAGQVVERYA